jgi:hypothetical protein
MGKTDSEPSYNTGMLQTQALWITPFFAAYDAAESTICSIYIIELFSEMSYNSPLVILFAVRLGSLPNPSSRLDAAHRSRENNQREIVYDRRKPPLLYLSSDFPTC